MNLYRILSGEQKQCVARGLSSTCLSVDCLCSTVVFHSSSASSISYETSFSFSNQSLAVASFICLFSASALLGVGVG
ncbi:hypothetical protein ACFXTO_025544 [Malus domestica]